MIRQEFVHDDRMEHTLGHAGHTSNTGSHRSTQPSLPEVAKLIPLVGFDVRPLALQLEIRVVGAQEIRSGGAGVGIRG